MTRRKILTTEALLRRLEEHRRRMDRIIFTNGCFDLLHAGHVFSLEAPRAYGDVLVVAVNSDASVARLKGPGRPIVSENERARMLAALACVDYVVIFADDTPHRLLDAFGRLCWSKEGQPPRSSAVNLSRATAAVWWSRPRFPICRRRHASRRSRRHPQATGASQSDMAQNPLVRHAVTGFVVDRLPPGRQCVGGEDDERALAAYLDAVRNAQAMDRQAVRVAAERAFATDQIVDTVIGVLAAYRAGPSTGGESSWETADAREGRRGG